MITKHQVVHSYYRQEFHHVSLKNADNTPVRCRVNGKCKTWKTRPNEFRLPVKHGLRDCFYIDQSNAGEWYDPEFPNGVYPDTKEGVLEYLKTDSSLDLEDATVVPDSAVEGVWAVDLPDGSRTIVYLAGYKNPFGEVRELNDFETGEQPDQS